MHQNTLAGPRNYCLLCLRFLIFLGLEMIGDGGGDESGTADGGATGGQETLVNKVVLKCTSSLFTKERETTNVTFVTKVLQARLYC